MDAKNYPSQFFFSAIWTLFSPDLPIIGFYLINNNDRRDWILIQYSLEQCCRPSNQFGLLIWGHSLRSDFDVYLLA
jgi:hypothetical protein